MRLGYDRNDVDWGCPINWGNNLNRGLVFCAHPAPSAYGWGSTTVRDLTRKSDFAMIGLTQTAWVGAGRKGFGAIRFDNDKAHYLSKSTSLLTNAEPRPLSAVFCYRANSVSIANHSFYNNDNSNNPRMYVALRQVSGATYKQSLFSSAYVDSSNFTLTTTDYFIFGYTWDASDNVAFYLNGAPNGTATRTAAGTNASGCKFGTLDGSTAGFLLNGDLAVARTYNRILSAGEMSSLAAEIRGGCPTLFNRIRPIRYGQTDTAATTFQALAGPSFSLAAARGLAG